MHLRKILPYLPPVFSMSTAYSPPSNLQDPLIQQAPSSRRIVLRYSSNSVSGSYPLYDLLSISTQSGSISVSVTPHSASSEDPSQPARLELTSTSGTVHATLSEAFVEQHFGTSDIPPSDPPPSYSSRDYDDEKRGTAPRKHCRDTPSYPTTQSGIPDRDYITSVSTQSGSISGTFPLGARTELDSRSGSLNGVELVMVPGSGPRRLSTVSRDGSQSVRIVDDDYLGAADKDAWWEGMVARHESRSGSVNVEYPDSWEGAIEVETESGSVSVTGRGVEIISETRGRVIARKGGKGGGKVIVRAVSGSVNLRFG